MAFDFGAALSSLGQIAPAMSEGAEIRRQRLADAARVSQQSQAAQDEHAARLAQTEREKQLTAQEGQNARRYLPISTKPERGEDGKYYMLFMSPDNKIERLPVQGNYDPNAEKLATLQSLGIDPKSELGKQYLLGIKPTTGQPSLRQLSDGTYAWVEKPDVGLPSGTVGGGAVPPVVPVMGANGKPVVGRMPLTETIRTGDHWVQGNDGKWYKVPTTTVTRRLSLGQTGAVGNVPSTGGRTSTPALATAPNPAGDANSPFPGGKYVGQGKLPASAEKVIITTQPVIDQTNALIKQIESLGLANNNQPGYLAKDYIAYRFGHASPDGTLGSQIAALSLGSVVDAASALQGSSRSITALKKAMEHTPNPLVDSPKLLHEKLLNINSRLNDMVNEARSGGQGQSVSQSPSAWEDNAVSADGKIKLGLRNGKWYNKATGKEYKP